MIVALLLGGCTVPAAAPPPQIIVMPRHRIILPDGDWPVLITHSDPAAATISVVLIAFTGPPEWKIRKDDPAVRTMTVTVPVTARAEPCRT